MSADRPVRGAEGNWTDCQHYNNFARQPIAHVGRQAGARCRRQLLRPTKLYINRLNAQFIHTKIAMTQKFNTPFVSSASIYNNVYVVLTSFNLQLISLSAVGEPSAATVVAAFEAHRGGLTGQSGEKKLHPQRSG